jgi:hypothetical protein
MRKVRFRDRKSDEATVKYLMALTLCQPRHDKHGNPIPGFSAEEVRNLSPCERRKLRLQGCGRDLNYEDFVNLRFPTPKEE